MKRRYDNDDQQLPTEKCLLATNMSEEKGKKLFGSKTCGSVANVCDKSNHKSCEALIFRVRMSNEREIKAAG